MKPKLLASRLVVMPALILALLTMNFGNAHAWRRLGDRLGRWMAGRLERARCPTAIPPRTGWATRVEAALQGFDAAAAEFFWSALCPHHFRTLWLAVRARLEPHLQLAGPPG